MTAPVDEERWWGVLPTDVPNEPKVKVYGYCYTNPDESVTEYRKVKDIYDHPSRINQSIGVLHLRNPWNLNEFLVILSGTDAEPLLDESHRWDVPTSLLLVILRRSLGHMLHAELRGQDTVNIDRHYDPPPWLN